jgi:hypothetical protein
MVQKATTVIVVEDETIVRTMATIKGIAGKSGHTARSHNLIDARLTLQWRFRRIGIANSNVMDLLHSDGLPCRIPVRPRSERLHLALLFD